jgi:hypothetical protein
MNELIKELLEQAGVTYAVMPKDTVYEKFAELIVRECAAQCWTVSELESKGFVVSECTKRMRKHFGVE